MVFNLWETCANFNEQEQYGWILLNFMRVKKKLNQTLHLNLLKLFFFRTCCSASVRPCFLLSIYPADKTFEYICYIQSQF